MAEYIKTTDAITTTWMILRGMGYAAEDNPDMVKTVAAVFDTAPSADVVERRKGHCIERKYDVFCSECGVKLICCYVDEVDGEKLLRVRPNFCPNCGAELREEALSGTKE